MNNLKKVNYFFLLSTKVLGSFFCTLLVFPVSLFNQPGLYLDNSWALGLQLATNSNFVFGSDFIFTYGPLGYFITRLPMAVSKLQIILFDFYILVQTAVIVYLIFRVSPKFLTYIAVLLILFLVGSPFNYDLVFFMSAQMLFCLFYFIQNGGKWLLLNALLLCVLLFFIKVNVGIVVIFVFIVFLVYSVALKKVTKYEFVFSLFLQFILLVVGSFVLHVNLIQYFISSISILTGYNDAMYWPLDSGSQGKILINSAIFIFAVVSIESFILLRYKVWNLYQLLISSTTLFFIFILFKQSFVRADGLHIPTFFSFVSLFFGIYVFFAQKVKRKNSVIALAIVVFCSFFILNKQAVFLPSSWSLVQKVKNVARYFHDNNSVHAKEFTDLKTLRTIPLAVFEKVKNSSVDIIPYEISYVALNNLKYNPRPIIQSYSAYNGYLMRKNYQKYVSHTAPEYVFFSTNTIDNRYSFWDDALVKIALFTHFEMINPISPTFDEEFYLREYADVKSVVEQGLVKSGQEHFSKRGRGEGRLGAYINFHVEESNYLNFNGDVAAAIANGQIPNAQTHYQQHGFREARRTSDIAMLFKKRQSPRELVTVNTFSTPAYLNQKILIPQTQNLLFLKVDLKNSLKGLVQKFVFQPEELRIKFELENGSTFTRKGITSIMNEELLANIKIDNDYDAYVFYKADGNQNQKIVSLTFEGDPSMWNQSVDLQWIEKRLK